MKISDNQRTSNSTTHRMQKKISNAIRKTPLWPFSPLPFVCHRCPPPQLPDDPTRYGKDTKKGQNFCTKTWLKPWEDWGRRRPEFYTMNLLLFCAFPSGIFCIAFLRWGNPYTHWQSCVNPFCSAAKSFSTAELAKLAAWGVGASFLGGGQRGSEINSYTPNKPTTTSTTTTMTTPTKVGNGDSDKKV